MFTMSYIADQPSTHIIQTNKNRAIMLNILHTKIAFVDWVKENVLNKIATKIVYNGDKETYWYLEVTDTLEFKDMHFRRCTWRTLRET